MSKKALLTLKQYYQSLNRFSQWLLPTELRSALDEEELKLGQIVKTLSISSWSDYWLPGLSQFYHSQLGELALRIYQEGKDDPKIEILLNTLPSLEGEDFMLILDSLNPYLRLGIIQFLLELELPLEPFRVVLSAFKNPELRHLFSLFSKKVDFKPFLWLKELKEALALFKDLGLLEGEEGPSVFYRILLHPNPQLLASVLTELQELNFLTKERALSLIEVIRGKSFSLLEKKELNESEKLLLAFTQEFRLSWNTLPRLREHLGYECHEEEVTRFFAKKHKAFFTILKQMKDCHLFTGELGVKNGDLLFNFFSPHGLDGLLQVLHETGLMTQDSAQDYFDRIISKALFAEEKEEERNDLFYPDNSVLSELEEIVQVLHGVNFFSEPSLGRENFIKLMQHSNLKEIRGVIRFSFSKYGGLNNPRFLNGAEAQEDFELLLRHASEFRVFSELVTSTQFHTHWGAIKAIIKASAPGAPLEHALRTYIHRYILIESEKKGLNGAQSTHTATVHLTTELSAWLLITNAKKAKKSHLTAETTVVNFLLLKEEITLLPPTKEVGVEEIKAAAECLTRLMEAISFISLDKEKKVNCLRLIEESPLKDDEAIKALIPYLRESVETNEEVSLQEFILLIVAELRNSQSKDYLYPVAHALYESERGYNLDEKGEDNEAQDNKHICYGGTGNKCCERLQGFSSLIQFIYINEKSIEFKLRKLSLEALVAHFQELHLQAQTKGEVEKAAFCQAFSQLESPEGSGEIFLSLFDEDCILESLDEEFKAWVILKGENALKEELKAFKNSILPYFPNIDLNAPCESLQHFYTLEALKVFHRLNEDRKAWDKLPMSSMDGNNKGKEEEKEENVRSSSVVLKRSFSADALKVHGFLGRGSVEDPLSSSPDKEDAKVPSATF